MNAFSCVFFECLNIVKRGYEVEKTPSLHVVKGLSLAMKIRARKIFVLKETINQLDYSQKV